MHRAVRFALLGALTLALGASAASAGLFEDLYRGLQLAATPSGYNLTTVGDGRFANGSRLGGTRIIPNEFGNGYRIDYVRNYGADSWGRPETLDLGPYALTLSGSTSGSIGYTKRGWYTVQGDLTYQNLAYSSQFKTGAIDVRADGLVNMNSAFEVNQFGFYKTQFQLTQDNAQIVWETPEGIETENIDFDLGPVTLRGNVFLDMIIGILGAAGVDVSGIAPQSPMDQINAAIEDAIRQQSTVAGEYLLSDDSGDVLLASVTFDSGDEDGDDQANRPAVVPEPATVLLLLLGAAAIRRR